MCIVMTLLSVMPFHYSQASTSLLSAGMPYVGLKEATKQEQKSGFPGSTVYVPFYLSHRIAIAPAEEKNKLCLN